MMNKAKASGGAERIDAPSKALVVTGESKTPFSQGIVPRKAQTMPKPEWHAPWKLMRVMTYFIYLPNISYRKTSRHQGKYAGWLTSAKFGSKPSQVTCLQ